MTRKSLSKKTRFEVFKRDLFTCQYCGATPPAVVLEVDHIEPVAEGGTDDEGNLVTACFDCNRGKAARLLSVAPEALSDRAGRIAEAEAQLAAYRDLMREVADRKENDIWEVIEALYERSTTTQDKYKSVSLFLERLPFDAVLEAARVTRMNMRFYSDARIFRYFCSICWRLIKKQEPDDGQD